VLALYLYKPAFNLTENVRVIQEQTFKNKVKSLFTTEAQRAQSFLLFTAPAAQ